MTAKRTRDRGRGVAKVDRPVSEAFEADPIPARPMEILAGIPGLGEITAFTPLIEMPELGTLTGKQAASPAGLAPVARQSGKVAGQGAHLRRTTPTAPGAPHARPRRHAPQQPLPRQGGGTSGTGKTVQSRHHGHHAQTGRCRQRHARQRRGMETAARMTITRPCDRRPLRHSRSPRCPTSFMRRRSSRVRGATPPPGHSPSHLRRDAMKYIRGPPSDRAACRSKPKGLVPSHRLPVAAAMSGIPRHPVHPCRGHGYFVVPGKGQPADSDGRPGPYPACSPSLRDAAPPPQNNGIRSLEHHGYFAPCDGFRAGSSPWSIRGNAGGLSSTSRNVWECPANGHRRARHGMPSGNGRLLWRSQHRRLSWRAEAAARPSGDLRELHVAPCSFELPFGRVESEPGGPVRPRFQRFAAHLG